MDLTELTAEALSTAIRGRDVSCREVMRNTLDRIGAVNPAHNAIVSLRDADALLQEADACDARVAQSRANGAPPGWMHGAATHADPCLATASKRA